MNRLVFYCWRIQEEFCKKHNIFRLVNTKYGVKTINVKMVRQMPRIINRDCFELEPSDLFLGIDYLNDDNTLLGKSILDSPHIYFIESILNGNDLNNTDYILRRQNGTLDERRGVPRKIDYSLFKERCLCRVQQLDDMQPVLVYQVRGTYYIYDGKHRAALCALKGRKVKCVLVENQFWDNAFFKFMQGRNNYSKHLSLL